MTTPAKFQLLCAALLALGPLAASPMEGSSKPYVVLDQTLSQLRADFNANVGKLRMLYIVGPTCGICLRGLSDLQEAVYSKKGDDPRLVTFVVHVPTLGARENSVAEATQLISNRYTTNYWEETGIVGRLIQQSMGFSKYTWDYWTIYDPSTLWSDDRMPTPAFWQLQLDGLPRDHKLDATAFAAKVDEMLAHMAPTAAGSEKSIHAIARPQ